MDCDPTTCRCQPDRPKLPEELKNLYEALENFRNISESARKLFFAVLAACLYCWLTIATTKDVNLLSNRASSPLPIIQTSIPIFGVDIVSPLLLVCVYFYFHFYLQKLGEELGESWFARNVSKRLKNPSPAELCPNSASLKFLRTHSVALGSAVNAVSSLGMPLRQSLFPDILRRITFPCCPGGNLPQRLLHARAEAFRVLHLLMPGCTRHHRRQNA